MPKKKFKCSKCDRSFSMAAHLARHVSTLHASPKARKAKAAKAAAKKRRSRKGGTKKRGTAKKRGPAKKRGRPSGVVSRLGLRDMTLQQLGDVINAAREMAQRKIAEMQHAFR